MTLPPFQVYLLGDELKPLLVGPEVLVGDGEEGGGGIGALVEFHPRFPGGLPRLFMVAGDAGADHILPFVSAPLVAGDDMVQGQLPGLPPAILAGKVVPVEDLKTGEPLHHRGPPHLHMEPDDRRDGENGGGGLDFPHPILYHLGLVHEEQDYRPTQTADIQGLVVLVQHQDRVAVYHTKTHYKRLAWSGQGARIIPSRR